MNEQFKDLCRWIYYTGRFLNYCDYEQGQQLQIVRDEFLRQERLVANKNFRPWNQGAVVMMLYGLFVLPKEFWRNYLGDDNNERALADNIIFEGFQFDSRGTFADDGFANADLNTCQFLRRLRNACAHANIDVDVANNRIRFRNYDHAGNINFAVSNDLAGLTQFVGEMSRFFINQI
jgi:hypothetical protein